MQEIWKDIPGYEGHYQISNHSNVRTLCYLNKKNCIKLLKPVKAKTGYLVVNLHKNNKATIKYVHRLVAEAFIPNPENKPHINHIDGNKSNPAINNLEWVTPSENQIHAYNLGLHVKSTKGMTGALCKNSKPILQFSKDGVFIRSWSAASEAARYYGVSAGNIWSCIHGKRITAYGYKWTFAPTNSSSSSSYN